MEYNNFNEEKELAELEPDKDYKFGAESTPSIYAVPADQLEQYLPLGEVQRGSGDVSDCASRGPINFLEAEFTYAYQNNLIKPENKKWLADNGYIVGGKVVFSDAFISIKSGTTASGNSLKAPCHAIYKNGLIPKAMLPLEKWMNFTAYTDPERITKAMDDLGLEFLRRFTINYDQVQKSEFESIFFKYYVVIALYAWPFPKNGIYPVDDRPFNHVVMKFGDVRHKIFDNYLDEGRPDDYIKVLVPDYKIFDHGYRMYVSAENVPSNKPDFFSIAILWVSKIIAWSLGGKKGTMPVMPKELEPSDANVPIDGPKPKQETLGERIAEFTESMIGRDASPRNKAPQDKACAETIAYMLHHEIPDFPEDIVGTIELNKALASSSHFKRTLEPFPGCVTVYPSIMVNGVITIHGHAFIYITNDKMCSNDSATGLLKQNYTRQKAIHYYHDILGLKGYIYAPVD